jgi:hypothetical protein
MLVTRVTPVCYGVVRKMRTTFVGKGGNFSKATASKTDKRTGV